MKHAAFLRPPLGFAVIGLLLANLPHLSAQEIATTDGLFKVAPVAPIKARAFDLKDVRLLAGPFRDAMVRDQEYLLSLDADRLLHTFRLTAGLPTSATPLGGWEAPTVELRGHSLGHYLSACALMYASTGDERLKTRARAIVAELAKCQEAMPARGYNRGYLAAFAESFFDRVDAAQPVWAPYYTLHKIMAGLLDVHVHCANPQALEVLTRMADWLKLRVDRLSTEQMQRALGIEHGGMNEVLANLYAVTANPDHLRLARAFDHRAVFDPLARAEDRLDGLHANTQIPKLIGAAREYELTGQAPYRDIATFFWQRVALHRSYVIGGHSDGEHFFPIGQFARHLSPETAETCNTYNMLKLTRHLFAWAPDAQTMDFYERALFNHILASQDPWTGMFAYLVALKPGHFKTYSTPLDSFWCCVGTGMENHAKYGDTIYAHDTDSLFVNLFIASQVNWAERGLVVRQETRFPEESATRLVLRCAQPTTLTLKIRRPSWATGEMSLRVNGRKTDIGAPPGSYLSLARQWRDGDRVELSLPMHLRLEPLPGVSRTVAVLYGPLVLAGALGTEGLGQVSPYAKDQLDQVGIPTPPVPDFVCDDPDLVRRIRPVKGEPLTFQTRGLGQPSEVKLIPFYQLHHQRYSVYWKVYSQAEWSQHQVELAAAEETRKALERRTVDVVWPGVPGLEAGHHLQGEQTQSGEHMGRKWRHTINGGWFSYDLKVAADRPLTLLCTYWGSDAGGRTFDILVDGEKIATQRLERNQPDEFFDLEYAIPAELLKGKDRVTVKFQAHPNLMAGGLYGLRVVRPRP